MLWSTSLRSMISYGVITHVCLEEGEDVQGSPSDGDLERECEDCRRGDRRDVVLLVVHQAHDGGHDILHGRLQLGMAPLPALQDTHDTSTMS